MFNLDKKIVKVKIGDLKPFGGNPAIIMNLQNK